MTKRRKPHVHRNPEPPPAARSEAEQQWTAQARNVCRNLESSGLADEWTRESIRLLMDCWHVMRRAELQP
ncbi:hypothetical protein [Terriglobus sp. RCC_193]|uniref:hypothetical protein n=1 Tax=Terriglobus sp. RCC_193 TaxID=3239218 RepID=UPI003524B8AA